MERPGFGVRFGYVRWLLHLLIGEAPSFAEIGKAVGVTGQAVSGWAKREDAPQNYQSNKALVGYFGVDESWLLSGAGTPPRADLWPVWLKARARRVGKLPPTLNDLGEVERGERGRGAK